jgi:hypothetical protein
MNVNQARIVVFWVAIIFASVLTDTPLPDRILYYAAFGGCFVLYYLLIAPLYPEKMKAELQGGLTNWIDRNPVLKTWVPIYYFGLAMFSVASMFLFPGVVGKFVSTPARLIPIIGFPFLIYFMKLHYELYKLIGRHNRCNQIENE